MIKRETAMAIIIIALLLLSGFLGCEWKKSKDNYDSSSSYISSLNDTLKHLKNNVVEIPQIIVTQKAFEDIVSQNKYLQKQIHEANIKLKNITSVSGIVTGEKLEKPIVIDLQSSSKDSSYLKSLQDYYAKEKYESTKFFADSSEYKIVGKINWDKDNIQFDTINFPDSISLITSMKKHLFAKNEYIVTARHSNHLVKTAGLMNMTIKEEKPLWDRRIYFIAAGIVGGFLLFHK